MYPKWKTLGATNAMEIHLWLLHLIAHGRTGKYRKLKLFRELWWHKQTALNLADTCLHDLLIRAVSESLKSNILSDFSAGLLVGALFQRAFRIGTVFRGDLGKGTLETASVWRSGLKGLNSKKREFDNSGSTEEASEERKGPWGLVLWEK